MTPISPASRPRPAGAEQIIERARAEAKRSDMAYVRHFAWCSSAAFGRLCRECQQLLDAADDAGKRWECLDPSAARGAAQTTALRPPRRTSRA